MRLWTRPITQIQNNEKNILHRHCPQLSHLQAYLKFAAMAVHWENQENIKHIHRDAEKRNHFSFMNKSFNTQRNVTKFSTFIVNEYYRRCYLFNFWNSY